MTRFNYAPSRFAALGAFRLSMGRPAVRGPLLALAASAVLVAATSAIQMMRLQTLEREASAIGAQRTVLEPALTRLRAAQRTVARLEAQAEARAAVLSSGTLRANEVASIGNALPRDAWLTALRVTPRTIALEGRTSRVRTVAATLTSLEHAHGVSAVRLISAHADAARPIVNYAIEVERSR